MDEQVHQVVTSFFAKYPQRTYKKEEIITRAGESPQGVLFIERGKVVQYDIANDGRKIVVNIFQPPSFFPMSWAINDTPNVYYYQAEPGTIVRHAPSHEVVSFVRSEPDVLFNLLSRVYRGTDGVLRRMAHALGGNASSLLAFEIMICCRRFGALRGPNHYVLLMTNQELAAHSGLSRETVNRQLQTMKKEGLLDLAYGKIIIEDIQKLETLLGTRL